MRARPATPAVLAAVKGFGPSRLERFGASVLQVIAACPTTASIEPLPTTPAPRLIDPSPPRSISVPNLEPATTSAPLAGTSPKSSYVPTEEWTWRLLDKGFTLNEAAAIRGLEATAVLRHALLVARQGKAVRAEAFLSPDQLRRWGAWQAEHGDAAPPSDHEGPVELWALFVACRRVR